MPDAVPSGDGWVQGSARQDRLSELNRSPAAEQSRGQRDAEAAYPGAIVRAEQPWADAALAQIFDLFHYDEDVPFYLDLAASQAGQILELACGSARLVLPLADAGHRVVGVDVSPHMLALAEKKVAAASPELARRVRLVRGDMRTFDLGEQFDLALIATKSFAYLVSRSDQQAALSALAAHLRPGGLLALDLLNPAPAWLMEPPGSLRQDIMQYIPDRGVTVSRTETVLSTDLAAQVRVVRSGYEVVAADGSITKRYVEWPYRYIYRFEAEHLLERAGFEIEALYGGYRRESFSSDSRTMLFLARRA